jgi:putative hemolysin
VFEFSDTVAREVMTPRVDLDALPVRSEPREVADLIEQSGHSRIPLYEDTDDQIVGIIHAKDLFMAMLKGGPVNLRRLMRPPLFVPEMKTLHELLQEMRQHKSQLAVVQDEYGGTAGIVTIEDIVEELVGDIVDEYDNEQPDVSGDDGLWTVNGKAHWSDVNYAIGSRFSSDEFDTVGGLVFGLFGRQPKSGEWIDADGYRIEVAKTDGRRILELAIRKLEPEEILLGDAQESA